MKQATEKEIRRRIRLCELSREKIEGRSEEIFRQFINGEMTCGEFQQKSKDELGGKTVGQWSLIYDVEIEKLREKLYKPVSENRNDISKLSFLFIVFAMLFTGLFYFNHTIQNITGFSVLENATAYSEAINITASGNSEYVWAPKNTGELKSLRISGLVIGNGSFRVYLNSGNDKYLILDNSALEAKDAPGITGLLIENLNETGEAQPPLPDENQASAEKIIGIKLQYKNNSIYDQNDDGVESIDSAIDYSVGNSDFNWDVNKSNLCTRWQVYSIENGTAEMLCYGSQRCCNFVDLTPSSESWDDIFYAYYGKYSAGTKNNVSAQALYVDYNLEPDNIYSDIYFSNWSILKAEFAENQLVKKFFSDACVDTCNIKLNGSRFAFSIETENSTLVIESISYELAQSAEQEANVTENSSMNESAGSEIASFQPPAEPAPAYANYAGNVPKKMGIQGKLTDINNNALTGTYNFTFRIYNVTSGGSALYEENQTLALNGGMYDAIISPTMLRFDQPYYLAIAVSNDSEMTPRINLTSSPYAFSATTSINLTCADCVDTSELENGTILDIDISQNAYINTSKIRHTGAYQDNISLNSIIDSIPRNFYNNTVANETFVNVVGDTITGNLNVSGNVNITQNVSLNEIRPLTQDIIITLNNGSFIIR